MNIHSEIKIPGYRIEKTLGKGGMATVYLATQMSLGRPVALKVLDDPESAQFFERFFNEGRCISRLNHSNLVAIFDIGQGEGFYYIAMEYLPGDDLKSRIMQGINPKAALRIIGQLATCLSYVHNQGIVHRDIKPSNVLFRNDGTPILTDFGIAKVLQTGNDLTVTGTVMGSPHYLSPEQAQESQKLDGRSDLYSLGVILFEMLTGRKPFTAKSFAATLMAHIQNPIPKLPEPHTHLQPLVNKLLAKAPEDRFQNGTELNKYLSRLRQNKSKLSKESKGTSAPAPHNVKKSKDKKPTTIWPHLIIAGVIAMAGIYYVQRPSTTEPATTVDILTVPATTDLSQLQPINLLELPQAEKSDTLPEPVETKPVTEEKPDPISSWLTQAEVRFEQNKLSIPKGDSANDLYNRVLERDPANAKALAGKSKIADRYAQFAQAQIAKGRPLKAQRYIAQGLSIDQDHTTLKRLSRQLEPPAPAPASAVEQEAILDKQEAVQVTRDPFEGLIPENDR